MREQEINASRLRGQIVLQHPSVGVGGFRLAEEPLEIGDVAIDGRAELVLAAVTAGDFVERRLALGIVDVASEHAALSGSEALPDLGRRAVVDGAGDLVETELTALLPWRGRTRAEARDAAMAVSGGFGAARQEFAHRPRCARLRLWARRI